MLEEWLNRTQNRLEGRVLTFNNRIATEWGNLMAEMEERSAAMAAPEEIEGLLKG